MVPLPTPHSPRFFIDHVAPEAALPRLEAVSLSCSRHDRETRMRDLTRRQLLQHLGLITAGPAPPSATLKGLRTTSPPAVAHALAPPGGPWAAISPPAASMPSATHPCRSRWATNL